jgi:hypothetical protein
MLPGVPPGPDSCHAAATPCRARQSSVTPQRPLAGLADRCAAADSRSHGSLTQKQKNVDLLFLKNVETFLKNVHQQNVEY